MIFKFLRKSRRKIEIDLVNSKQRKMISPIIFSQYEVTIPIIKKYICGKLLDIGCGYSPYRKLLQEFTTSYEGIDRINYNEFVTFVEDVQKMKSIADNEYDSSICLEVLEHIPNPIGVIREIHRILKPNGHIIVSVPLLSQLHEEPYDFFRFTKYGLIELFNNNGFEVVELHKKAGLLSFLGHQISIFWVSLFWNIPIIKYIILYINYVLITIPCYYFDKIFDRNGVFSQSYVLVAKKIINED